MAVRNHKSVGFKKQNTLIVKSILLRMSKCCVMCLLCAKLCIHSLGGVWKRRVFVVKN